jgi:hypothetical protein
MQSTLNPVLASIIAGAAQKLPPGMQAKVLADGSWQFDDNSALHFESGNDALLAVLRMPEQHLDAQQLTQLLMTGGLDWPIPVAASIDADETRALLFARLHLTNVDSDTLLQAILTLLSARRRWLQAPLPNSGLAAGVSRFPQGSLGTSRGTLREALRRTAR